MRFDRLIPAWAGKTWRGRPSERSEQAHPRVGGENEALRRRRLALAGSSPRGRGKRAVTRRWACLAGLIPAWAGKTVGEASPARQAEAHPRVGGENSKLQAALNREAGSSPRGRGKQ